MANTIATLPIKLYDADYNEPTDCSAYNVLKGGFRYFTKFDFFKDIEALRNLQGNAYVQKFYDVNGKVVGYGLVRPRACEPLIDLQSGELYYAISAIDNQLFQQTMYVHSSDMLHFKHLRFGSVTGINPIDVLQNTLDYDQEVRKISLNQLVGTNEGFIVKFEANMEEEAKQALITQIANFYKENGGLLIEENGVTITRMERNLVDPNLIDVDKVTRSRVAMVFNLPEHFLGDASSSFASLEQLNLEYLTSNLMPILAHYEEELNFKLLTPAQKALGYQFKFDFSALLKADKATLGAYNQMAIRSGWLTPNEARKSDSLPPHPSPEANKLYLSGDLYPIDTPIADRKGGEKQNGTTQNN
jgi:HK97 family phage portal protein